MQFDPGTDLTQFLDLTKEAKVKGQGHQGTAGIF